MLIIDAYNVIHAAGKVEPGLGGLTIAQMVAMIENARLVESGASRGGQVLVVCDGTGGRGVGGGPGAVDDSMTAPGAAVRVVFAGPGKDADSAIEKMLDELEFHGRARSATVVSSDKRVQQAALGVHAGRITSEQFVRSLVETLRRAAGKVQGEADRREGLSGDGSLDADTAGYWLKQFGVEASDPERRALEPRAKPGAPTAHAPSAGLSPKPVPPAHPTPDPLIEQVRQEWGADIDPTDLDMKKWLKE